jgi:hypothetical protein
MEKNTYKMEKHRLDAQVNESMFHMSYKCHWILYVLSHVFD